MFDQDIDVEALSQELDVKAKAIRQGRLNQPPPDATDFDVPQRDIVQRMTELLDQAQRDVQMMLDRHKTRRDEIEREMADLRLEDVPQDAESAIEREEHDQRPGLVKAREQERRMMRELRAFRAENNCLHEPSYPESFIFHWAVIAGIVLVESVANSYFFAKGSDLGLLGGLFQALLISVVNVVPALLMGSRVVPYLRHINMNLRVGAALALGLYVCVLLLFNLAVAHYRAVLESDPLVAIVLAIPNLIRAPLGIENLDAWVLFGLGNVFAVIAMLKAFSADDRYPGYGRLHRAYKGAEQVYQDKRQAIPDAINRVIDEHRRKIDLMIATGQANVREYGDLIGRSKAAAADYGRRAKALEEACNLLLKSYRVQNTEIRTEPPPGYWHDAFSFGDHAVMPPPDLREEEANLETFDTNVKAMRDNVGEATDALRRLNKRKLEATSSFFATIEAEADKRLKQEDQVPPADAVVV